MAKITVPVDKLTIGHYIAMPSGYIDHPFLLNSFKIKEKQQILIIKKMGIAEIEVDTDRSTPKAMHSLNKVLDFDPANVPLRTRPKRQIPPLTFTEHCRKALQQADSRYKKQLETIQSCFSHALIEATRSLNMADLLIGEVQMELNTHEGFQLCLIPGSCQGERIYLNALNTFILTLLIAREVGLDNKKQNILSQIALFHNLGELYVPEQIRNNSGELSKPEMNYYNQHPLYAFNKMKETGAYDNTVMQTIAMHHEKLDGSGYPKRLKGKQIPLPVQLISVADSFEELLNPRDNSKKISTNLAIAYLYKKAGEKFNTELVNALIKVTGLFPPGTPVKLGERFGLVVISNSSNLKRPIIKLHNPDEPKQRIQYIDSSEDESVPLIPVKIDEMPENTKSALNIPQSVNFFITRLEACAEANPETEAETKTEANAETETETEIKSEKED